MNQKIVIVTVLLSAWGVQAGDPLKVVREKGFYKTGAAAKNTSFVEWLKRPVFGEESSPSPQKSENNGSGNGDREKNGGFMGLFNSRPIKHNAALETFRDQGYKEKEARMREELKRKTAGEQTSTR